MGKGFKNWIVIGLILLNIFVIIILKGLKSEFTRIIIDCEIRQNQDSIHIAALEKIIGSNVRFSGDCNFLIETTELIGIDGKMVKLRDLVSSKPVIVFRFFKDNCYSCMKNEFIIIKETFSKEEQNNIIVITSEIEYSKNNRLKEMSGVSCPIYIIGKGDLSLPLDTLGLPYLFMLDSVFSTKHFFVPVDIDEYLTEDYFEFIKDEYW